MEIIKDKQYYENIFTKDFLLKFNDLRRNYISFGYIQHRKLFDELMDFWKEHFGKAYEGVLQEYCEKFKI